MKTIKDIFVCVVLAALTALAFQLMALVRAATASVAAIPVEIPQAREALAPPAGPRRGTVSV